MPFLPDSIRGDDYNIDKDESINIIQKNENLNKSPVGNYKPTGGIMNLNDILDDAESSNLDSQSNSEIPTTFIDIIKEDIFIGDVHIDSIMEGIEEQFDDYINLEDNTNYVDIFYDQLHASYEVENKSNEMYRDERIKELDNIQFKFINFISDLFKTRLTLNIIDIESESMDLNDIEFVIRRLYEFFILDARNNFKVAITNDIKMRMTNKIEDHREYLKTIKKLMIGYSPIITTFGPMEFLKYRGDQEIIQFFENGKVTGNFLRKYSPKLYQNEEFEVELINYITMVQQIKEEVFNNG